MSSDAADTSAHGSPPDVTFPALRAAGAARMVRLALRYVVEGGKACQELAPDPDSILLRSQQRANLPFRPQLG